MVFHFLQSGYNAIKRALKKTRDRFTDRLRALFSKPIDENLVEELETIFYEADLGVKTSLEMAEKTKTFLRKNQGCSADAVLTFLENEITQLLKQADSTIKKAAQGPTVILVVGVNGNGKTTTVAKLCKKLQDEGNTVLLAAADTFRAGAQEQLAIWADRLKVDLVSGAYKSDPAACAFDAVQAALSRGADYVIVDTAGRLENKTHLMKELEKIRKSIQKVCSDAPHETLLVLDATVGQNGLQNAKVFSTFTPLSGLILTKMDGTAKGGGAIAIQKELNIPIKWLGTGEGIDDLAPFEAQNFAHSLFFE